MKEDSPASHHSDSFNVDDDEDDEFRSHSFRERRLTYSRHHILSDTAATAVAELLAEGGDDFSDDNDDNDAAVAVAGGDGVDIGLQNNVNKKEEEESPKKEEETCSSPEKEGDSTIITTVATTFHKRRRFSNASSSVNSDASLSSTNGKNQSFYLPSRILHAGEIVRRYSSSEMKQQPSVAAGGGKEDQVTTTAANQQQQQTQHDVRTGVYSHPTHHATSKKYIHHYHHHGTDTTHTHHKNKWRQRFSFCSTTPDHILPFPRHIVGTFSCHGMEPVYDSDYDDNSDDDEEDDEQDANGGGNNNTTNNNTSIAKINQDRGGIIYPYANSHNMALFAVYDGHGEGGELVSQFALGEVSRILGGRLVDGLKLGSRDKKKEMKEEVQEGEVGEGERKKKRRRRGVMLDSVQEEGDCTNVDNDGQHNANNNNNDDNNDSNDDEEFNIIEQSFKETFLKVDRGLLNEEEIEPMYSGTTACVVLKRHQKLYIANCGDSRAVLARRRRCGESGRRSDGVVEQGEKKEEKEQQQSSFVTIPLSIDQNPDSPGEKERILDSGGYVSPPPEPGLTARVWLDPNMTQIGLAMARSIGDHAVKSVGVIAEPVVSVHTVDEELDEFVIIATDGVWEFISSEDAVDIVGRCLYHNNTNDGEKRKEDRCNGGDASEACEALIKAATAKWHEFEGDYRDDITAMVIRLKDLW